MGNHNKRRFYYPPGEIPRAAEGDVQEVGLRINSTMSNKIIDIANARYKGKSDTIRLLIQLGLDVYDNNKLAGRTNNKKNQQHRTKQAAEAKAIGAERERIAEAKAIAKAGGSGVVPAVTPLLIDSATGGDIED